jgi:Secretion system C-terminal sorting domain
METKLTLQKSILSKRFGLALLFILGVSFTNAQTYEISLPGNVREMPEDILGFNGQNTFESSSTWDEINSHNLNIFKLSPSTLRYPGGTVANLWDWRKGVFLNKSEFSENIDLPENYKGKNQFTNKENGIGNYFLNCLKNNSTPLLDLNILSSNFHYQLGSLYEAKLYGFNNFYVELGNEFYLGSKENRQVFPTVKHYIDRALKWTDGLKNGTYPFFNNIKVAVVGAESDQTNPGRRRLWLNNILNEVVKVPEVDAITVHIYLDSDIADIVNTTNGTTTPPYTCCDAIPANAEQIFKKGILNAFQGTNGIIQDEIAAIGTANKEAWITEYNMLNSDKSIAVNGSWFHGLFVAAMTFEMLQNSTITKIIPHTLIGDGIFSGLFNDIHGLNYGNTSVYTDPVQGACTTSSLTTEKYERTALGIAISPIADALKGCIKTQKVTLSEVSTNNPPMPLDVSNINYLDLQGMQFEKANGQVDYVFINFSSNNSRSIDLSSVIPQNAICDYNFYMTDKPFNFITGEPLDILLTHTDNKAYCFHDYQILNANKIINNIPQYSIVHVRVKPTDIFINLDQIELCCNSWRTYSVPKEQWREGWHWEIEGLPNSTDNPYVINANQFEANANRSVKLFNEENRLVGEGTLHTNPCITAPIIGVDNNYTIETKEYCPNDPMTFSMSIDPASVIVNPSYYSYLWIATGEFANPHATTTEFTPPKTGTDVYVIATNGTCWEKSNTINFKSLIPEGDIVVSNGTLTREIENDTLRLCDNLSSTNFPNSTVEFAFVPSNQNLAGYSINESWYYCDGTGNSIPLTIPLHDPCKMYLTTTVSGNHTCVSTRSIELLSEDCCEPNSSLVPTSANLMHSNINDLYKYLQTKCPTCTLNITGTPLDVQSLVFENISSDPLTINGLFEVDGDITLNNCHIQMGPNALIKLGENKKLNLVKCIINECTADKPWDGIISDVDNQYISIIGDQVLPATLNSSISGAKKAVDLSNNAEFLIANTNFENNQVNISIHDCATNIPQKEINNSGNIVPYSGFIYGNHFISDENKMKTLYGKDNLTHGIYLNSLDRITIGTKMTSIPNNLFESCEIGIIGNDASFTSLGNNFDIIHRPTTALNKEFSAAIASRNTSYFNDSKVTIGDEVNPFLGRNEFNNCAVSIDIDGELELDVYNNYFDVNNSMPDPTNNIIDIFIKNTGKSGIQILNNKFKYVNTGIHLYKPGNFSTANIYSNEFSDEQLLINNTDFSNAAIVINSPFTAHASFFTIENNSINGLRRGIFATKQKNLTIKNNSINDLSYTSPNPNQFPTIGIDLADCSDFDIKENIVASSISINNIYETLTGIKLSYANTGNVRCNTISNLGYGLSLNGNCMGTAIRQNTFNEFNSGIYRFAQTTLDNQGSITEPTNNSWSSSNLNSTRLDADANNLQVIWYYIAPGTSTDPRIGPNFDPVIYLATECINPIGPLFCISDHTSNLRYANINNSLQLLDTLTSDIDIIYNEKKDAYYLLVKSNYELKDSIIHLANVSTLISEIENGPADELNLMDSLIMSKPDSTLFSYLSSIPVSWAGDFYKQQVNRILLKETEKKLWDAQDSLWLDYIASIPRKIGGDAVISACAALRRECAEQNTNLNTSRLNNSNKKSANRLITYPNPTNEFISIQNGNNEDLIQLISIYDITGRTIKTLNCNGNQQLNISVKDLESGAYKIEVIYLNNKKSFSTFIKQ